MAADDGFREIQLSGKHLVFLFMATTVVAVVIFLCGVMVGRGVRTNTPITNAATEPAQPPVPDALRPADGTPVSKSPAAGAPEASAATAKTGQPPAEDLTYYSRLEGNKPPAENLKKPAPPTEPPDVAQEAPATVPAAAEAPAAGEGGWTVQVTALSQQSQADAIVKRLLSKGYDAYLLPPPPGGASLFRVRVGKYKERREAAAVAKRLEKEEQFKPFPTTR